MFGAFGAKERKPGSVGIPFDAAVDLHFVFIQLFQPGDFGKIGGVGFLPHSPVVFIGQRGMGGKTKRNKAEIRRLFRHLRHGGFAVAELRMGVQTGRIEHCGAFLSTFFFHTKKIQKRKSNFLLNPGRENAILSLGFFDFLLFTKYQVIHLWKKINRF